MQSNNVPQESASVFGYEFVETLYTSRRSRVDRAIETNSQRPVVIKQLLQDYPHFNDLQQFRHQYQIAQALDFPGIVQLYDLCPCGSTYAIVMEDFGGIALNRYLQQTNLDCAAVLSIAIQMAACLHYLHQQGVIHKDIKPANILIHPTTQQIKLTDFGIASHLPQEQQPGHGSPRQLEGTLTYLAPEQTGRLNRPIDYRSDFYSLGVTLYELFAGQPPFSATDPLELIHAHIVKPATDLTEFDVPPAIAAIVAKLLSKDAADRYQSALGLQHDLQHCQDQLATHGTIASFTLGERDRREQFFVSPQLYGRDRSVQTLLDTFQQVTQGTTELLLVAGTSGIGKTAVINEVHKPIVAQQGYFIQGKYDQFQRDIPLSAFIQAFRHLILRCLGESDADLAAWRSQIQAAIGQTGQVLIDVLPELEAIIGPQAAIDHLTGIAAEQRFNQVFQNFVQVFSTAEHPLVIFLDDLQWADRASLKLLQLLMQDAGHLLILGAYRDHEVDAIHPLSHCLATLQKSAKPVQTITLEPLTQGDVNQLIADTLACDGAIAAPLTELIYQKTQGNPFFTAQFLKRLHRDGYITFSGTTGSWECDLAAVRTAAITDDVVEFMVQQLRQLPDQTQTALQFAACIGAEFDLETLAVVSQQSSSDTRSALWPALLAGLVVPIKQTYSLDQQQVSNSEQPPNVPYRFLHDRVQQAAYELIPSTARTVIHRQIGQLLLQTSSADTQATSIFSIVNQLNQSGTDELSVEMRLRFAELNGQACQQAKQSTAYDTALHYIQASLAILPHHAWQEKYSLTFDLYHLAVEVAYLSGEFDLMNAWGGTAIAESINVLDAARINELKILALVAKGDLAAAIDLGIATLATLDIDIPTSPTEADIAAELQFLTREIETVGVENILNLPPIDVEGEIILKILATIAPASYLINAQIWVFIMGREITTSLSRGNGPLSGLGYIGSAIVSFGMMGDFDAGRRMSDLALEVTHKYFDKAAAAQVLCCLGLFSSHPDQHCHTALPFLQQSQEYGFESGEFDFSCWAYHADGWTNFLIGTELQELKQVLQQQQDRMQSVGQTIPVMHHATLRQMVLNFMGESDAVSELSGTAFDETTGLAQYQKNQDLAGLFRLHLYKLMLGYHFGQYAMAQQHATLAFSYIAGCTGQSHIPIVYFFSSLNELALYSNTPITEQPALIERVEQHLATLTHWASYAPMNYQHRCDLITAELKRCQGDRAAALEFYDRAIEQAQQHGYQQDAALANELAARFYLDWRKPRVAAEYLQNAYYGYARWGAKAKTQALESAYPELLAPILSPTTSSLTANTIDVLATFAENASANIVPTTRNSLAQSKSGFNTNLDFAAVLNAAQAIARVIEVEDLLQELTQIILRNAGGDYCIIALAPDQQMQDQALEVNWVKATTEECILGDTSFSTRTDMPQQLIQYVKQCQTSVIIDDLQTQTPHPDLPIVDTYLSRQNPKSLLCCPIRNQGKLIGVLYLHNQCTAGAFTRDRQLVLNFLCTQAAISLENARLFRTTKQTAEALHTSQTQLQTIADNLPGAIYKYQLDADGHIHLPFISHRVIEVLGVDRYDLQANLDQFFGRIHTADQASFQARLAESMEQLSTFAWIGRFIRPSGEECWLDISSIPTRQANGAIAWDGVMLDVTEREVARREREAAQQIIVEKSTALEQALTDLQGTQLQMVQSEKMASLGNLVVGVAHEINNPIGFLNGSIKNAEDYIQDLIHHIDLYQEHYPDAAPTIQDDAEDIDLEFIQADLPKLLTAMQGANERIKSISKSLRTFSRADKEHKIIANIHDGIDSTILILKYRLKANSDRPLINVETNYGPIPEIPCFPGQLNQVFMNILANAIDVFDEATQTASYQEIEARQQQITITTGIVRDEDVVEIRIRDNGKGMPESVRTRIFDHLFTTKAVGKGTGLGMAIAHQIIVDTHGGRIDVHSTVGQGSEFIIRLPIDAETDAVEASTDTISKPTH